MINPKHTTQLSVVLQRNVCHSTVGTVASGYGMTDSDIGSQFLNVQQVTVSAARKLLISHFLQFQSANIKILSRQSITVTKQPS